MPHQRKPRPLEIVACRVCEKQYGRQQRYGKEGQRPAICGSCRQTEVSRRPETRERQSAVMKDLRARGILKNVPLEVVRRPRRKSQRVTNSEIRRSLEYIAWRKAVLERDRYRCVSCDQVGGELQVDHIKPFALFPELRMDMDNGRTLCKPCHKLIGYSRAQERVMLMQRTMEALL